VCVFVCVCVVVASSTAVSDPAGARRLGNASIGLSIAGIVVTVIVIIVAVAVVASAADDYYDYDCNYTYYGTCYRRRSYVGTYGYCSGIKSNGYCYYD